MTNEIAGLKARLRERSGRAVSARQGARICMVARARAGRCAGRCTGRNRQWRSFMLTAGIINLMTMTPSVPGGQRGSPDHVDPRAHRKTTLPRRLPPQHGKVRHSAARIVHSYAVCESERWLLRFEPSIHPCILNAGLDLYRVTIWNQNFAVDWFAQPT